MFIKLTVLEVVEYRDHCNYNIYSKDVVIRVNIKHIESYEEKEVYQRKKNNGFINVILTKVTYIKMISKNNAFTADININELDKILKVID